jgi:hypothetical protein
VAAVVAAAVAAAARRELGCVGRDGSLAAAWRPRRRHGGGNDSAAVSEWRQLWQLQKGCGGGGGGGSLNAAMAVAAR